jgi:hypothetical protein
MEKQNLKIGVLKIFWGVLGDRLSDKGGRNYSFQSFISECAEKNKDMIEGLENTASENFSGETSRVNEDVTGPFETNPLKSLRWMV